MTKLTSKKIKVTGKSIHLQVGGKQKSQPPILLIHGLAVSSRYMIPLAEQLSDETSVYVVDLPGFGKSDKPSSSLTIRELANSLLLILDTLSISKGVLIGHSFGTQVVIDLAERYPNRIAKLILIGPTVEAKERSLWKQSIKLLQDTPHEPLSFFFIVIKDVFEVGLRRTFKNAQFSLTDQIEKKLPNIVNPVLVVRGEKDAISTQQWQNYVVSLLKNAKALTIPGAAHVVNYTHSKRLASHIKNFLLRNT